MSRKTREKERKEQEARALMDPQKREQLEQKERERREQLEQRRSERREQLESELNERLKKKRIKQTKKFLIVASIPVAVVALIIILIVVFRPVTKVFSYSDWIDDNGFWKGIKALDYVDNLDYRALQIPAEVHQITDDEIQSEIDGILTEHTVADHITDRPVVDGDEVNIDYTGSIDGVEFENGSTDGEGADVIIGVTTYIDDFLEQLIGHMPGETIDVEVTFPDDYYEEDLQGKDALFITTINYIIDKALPDLTDDYVADNLSSEHGWYTVAEMRENIRSELQRNAIQQYINDHLTNDTVIKSIPDPLIECQKLALIDNYQKYADSYGMELGEFISTYAGHDSIEDFIASNQENFLENAVHYLILQAVAEDYGFTASEEDVADFFIENIGDSDYSIYEEQYGLPYLKQVALNQKVMDFIRENAVLI